MFWRRIGIGGQIILISTASAIFTKRRKKKG